MIETTLAEHIQTHYLTDAPMIVAIGGAADLGKSYLSQSIVRRLNERGIKSGHLTLDSFLMDRTLRKSKGFSGYQIESYDIENALQALKHFKACKPLCYHPYDHKSGKKGAEEAIPY